MIRNLLLIISCLVSFSFSSFAADSAGTTEEGEGGELVIQEGLVVREIATDSLPLIAVGSASGAHYLYDPNQFAMQGVWRGVFGRTDRAGMFVAADEQIRSFSLQRTPPWSFGEKPRRNLQHRWDGYQIREGKVYFRYRISDKDSGVFWDLEETLEIVTDQLQRLHFSINASAQSNEYLNYWVTQTDFRSLTTNGQQNQRNLLKNLLPNQKAFTISFLRRKETPTIPNGYAIESIDVPAPAMPFRFEPTAIDFSQDGIAYVSTRTGGVWRRRAEQWSLFADGLHEANGVKVTADGVYVMQKPELTLLRDTDNDGVADVYETVEDRFRFTGHYHEFAYGAPMTEGGELFFSSGLASSGYFTATPKKTNQMTSALGYRGWVMRHNADGSLSPFASGLRSPAGIGLNAQDELFITDNQGDWVASSYLGHVEQGDFLGHPASQWDRPEFGITPAVLDYQTNSVIPEEVPPLDIEQFERTRKLPAVWLSHGDLTNSPGNPAFAPSEGFGPFGGQAFIADIAHRNIVRVALEKVGGKYQGAVFPFIRPLKSSSYSTAFDPQGRLWVGSVGRGWTAGEPAIEIISFAPGQLPFEMHRIELTRTGFDIVFTQPIADQPIDLSAVAVTEYRYEYWEEYGSERIDEALVPLRSLEISTDRLRLSIKLPLKERFIYQIQLPELKAASGLVLDNNYGIYTLNQLRP